MKNTILIFLILLLTNDLHPQFLTFRNTSSVYLFESRDENLNKVLNNRLNNNLFFNYTNSIIGFKGNIHLYNDLKSSGSNNLKNKISTLNLSSSLLNNNLNLSVGRQYIAAISSFGLIDGLNMNYKLFNSKMSVNAFAGNNIIKSEENLFSTNFKNNSNFGTNLQFFPNDNLFFRIGYSSKNWKKENYTAKRIDSLFEPTTVTVISNPNAERYLSFDASFDKPNFINLYLKSDLNFLSHSVTNANLFVKYKVTPSSNLSLEYFYREPRLNFNSIFSVFHSNSIREIETSFDYNFNPQFHSFIKLAQVNYIDENSTRISLGTIFKNINFNYSRNFGYAGDFNGVSILASEPFFENRVNFSLGVGYANYKISKESPLQNTSNLIFGSAYRPTKNLSLDANLQWLNNPHFKSDFRALLKLSYFFNKSFLNNDD